MADAINPYTGKPYNEGLVRVEGVTRVPIIGGWREDRSYVSYEVPSRGGASPPLQNEKMVTRNVMINGKWVESTEPESLGGTGGKPVQFSRIGTPKIETITTITPIPRIIKGGLPTEPIGVDDEKTRTSRIIRPVATMEGGGILFNTGQVSLASTREGGFLSADKNDILYRSRVSPQEIMSRAPVTVMPSITPEQREQGRLQRLQQEDLTREFSNVEAGIQEAGVFNWLKDLRTTTSKKESFPKILGSIVEMPSKIRKDLIFRLMNRTSLQVSPKTKNVIANVWAGPGALLSRFVEGFSDEALMFPEFATNVAAKAVVTYGVMGKYAQKSPQSVFRNILTGGERAVIGYVTEVPKAILADPLRSAGRAAFWTVAGISFKEAVKAAPRVFGGTTQAIESGGASRGQVDIDWLKKKKRLQQLQQELPAIPDDILSGEAENLRMLDLLKKRKKAEQMFKIKGEYKGGWETTIDGKAYEVTFEQARVMQEGSLLQKILTKQQITQVQRQAQVQMQRQAQVQMQRQAQVQMQRQAQVQLQNLRSWPGQFQMQKQKQVQSQVQTQKQVQRQVQVLMQPQLLKQTQVQVQLQKQTQKQVQRQVQVQSQVQTQKQVQRQVQVLMQPQLFKQTQVQVQLQKQTQKQVQRQVQVLMQPQLLKQTQARVQLQKQPQPQLQNIDQIRTWPGDFDTPTPTEPSSPGGKIQTWPGDFGKTRPYRPTEKPKPFIPILDFRTGLEKTRKRSLAYRPKKTNLFSLPVQSPKQVGKTDKQIMARLRRMLTA